MSQPTTNQIQNKDVQDTRVPGPRCVQRRHAPGGDKTPSPQLYVRAPHAACPTFSSSRCASTLLTTSRDTLGLLWPKILPPVAGLFGGTVPGRGAEEQSGADDGSGRVSVALLRSAKNVQEASPALSKCQKAGPSSSRPKYPSHCVWHVEKRESGRPAGREWDGEGRIRPRKEAWTFLCRFWEKDPEGSAGEESRARWRQPGGDCPQA